MPLKTDASKSKRWVEMEVVVPGTAERVWKAIATGDGYSSWFTKTTIEERIAGNLTFILMGHPSPASVTSFVPPLHFGYVEDHWAPDAPPISTDITVTPRPNDKCLVRMTHTLTTTSTKWDDDLEGFEKGWPGFFKILHLYLEHFAAKPNIKPAPFQVMHQTSGKDLEVWKRFLEELSLTSPNAGETRSITTPEKLTGIIEHTLQDETERHFILRLTDPTPGILLAGTFALGNKINVGLSFYLYGDDAEARSAASKPKWEQWLRKTFPK